MRTHRALTLVELIVVIAVTVVLSSLILVATSGVARSSRTAACLANLRSLQLAATTYATDHRGRLIDAGLPHGNLEDGDAVWISTLEDYYDTAVVLRSPLDGSPHWSRAAGGVGEPVSGTTDVFRVTSYGLNNYLTQYSPYQALENRRHDRLAELNSPAGTVQFLIMVFTDDAGFSGADHVHAESWTIDPPVLAASQMQTNAAGGPVATAASRSNYSFADGHVGTREFGAVYLDAERNAFDPEAIPALGAVPSGAGG